MDDTELLVLGAAAIAIISLSEPIKKIVNTVTNPLDTFFGTFGNTYHTLDNRTLHTIQSYTTLNPFGDTPWYLGGALADGVKSWGDPDKWFS